MKNKNLAILIVLLFGLTAAVFAQSPAVIVEYYENTSGEMYVLTPDGVEYDVDDFGFGEELPVGTTLITLDGDYAELRMDPNGTIIRVGENTNFRVDGLQGCGEAQKNTFSVAVGKFKAVVAKRDGALYSFHGPTAVMGVRGTKLIGWIKPGEEELAFVLEGFVDYTNAAGKTVALGAGQAANALAADFSPFQVGNDLRQSFERGMEFVQLRIEDVVGYQPPPEDGTDEGGEGDGDDQDKGGDQITEVEEKDKTPEAEAEAETPAWVERLMEFLGMELGTTTIEEQTWAKAIIQPKFALGKLKVALYLPIIYKEDMLDPSDWYRPEGNDEWSFGTDQDGWDQIALDALNDLFLKIRYIEWGDNRDPFFFKFGNLADFTIGHGSIMRNYANDSNFPTERKIGLNLGVNKEKGGLELMVNDAADPEIFGFRAHTRPFAPGFKLGFGLTALADINPERAADGYGDARFFNFGLDLDQPIIEREALSVILFADLASMVPYFASSGFDVNAVWYDGKPKNWGVDAGVLGNLLFLDYRLEFMYSDGIFRPRFFGPSYDRVSPIKVAEFALYLGDPGNQLYDLQRMGVYGELGFTLERVLYIEGGYGWNWPVDPLNADEWVNDMFMIGIYLNKKVLPVYGSIHLWRDGLVAPLLNGESITFFDENLILAGELVYPISPILELAIQVQSNVIGGQWYPSWSVLTRLNG